VGAPGVDASPAADFAAGLFDRAAEPAAEPDAVPAAGLFDRAADGDPAGEAALDPPDGPALPPTDAAPGTAAGEPADPESVGAATAPVSPDEYPPPEAAALVPATFWLWTLRAARWAALPPQAAEASAPAVRRTKRRRVAMQLTPLLPSVGERTFECS
jgi:hypothetical protein